MKTMLLCLLLAARCACAQPLSLPGPPAAAFTPRAGTALPLDARFVDDTGRGIRLGDLFVHKPVVLVPGYYTCPNLCSTLFEGVMQALALSGLDADAYQLAGVSIDAADTPARAAAKKRAYAAILPGSGANLHLLTGRRDDIAALAGAIGYRYSRDGGDQLAHAAGFVVATPDGHVARYFPGVRFDPADLRDAVKDAQRGATGGIASQLLLLCAHYDPATGRYSLAAMTAVRAAGLLVLAMLLGWMWRRRTNGGSQ
jgi:protein SCO1/2